MSALAACLESLVRRYDRRWIDTDPLRFPRAYDDAGDREVAAVVASVLAYGRVASILASVAGALAALGPHPAATLADRRPGELGRRLRRFRHRWTDGSDLAWLLEGVARAREEGGTLGALVAAEGGGAEPLRAGLARWHDAARRVGGVAGAARARARAFLLPDPHSGAACKRLLLLARWCVRPDDGLDLGLWRGLAPRDLLVPLDVHAHRVARLLGLTRRRAPDWRAAVEVTDGLRALDPDDPVRFDFALVRPGIVGRCRYRLDAAVCGPCDLRPACRVGRRLASTALVTP